MIRLTYTIELITPAFCGGADPEQHAEIRPASIRGQLRWWFRVLGGFRSLAEDGMSLRDQEDMIFGTAAGDDGAAGKLIVRTRPLDLRTSRKDSEELGHRQFSDSAYLTFPLQTRPNQNGKKGVIDSGSFELHLIWRGKPALLDDIKALTLVFANFGALGFRSRRAMGALACKAADGALGDWTAKFSAPDGIDIRSLPATDSADAIRKLGGWLRSWRSHGRTTDHDRNTSDQTKPPLNRGFGYAKRDHDIGYGNPETVREPAFRPALGLPIIQRTGRRINNWEFGRGTPAEPKGRFASPVILRPHRDASGKWRALVIFVEARRWPEGKKVFLNGSPRDVSLDLYEAMKRDPQLTPFR